MKNFFVKMIDGIGEERLNDFFKSKKKSFLFWYILTYVIVAIFDCVNFNWGLQRSFFPLKLYPLLIAKNIGTVMNKRANKEFFSPQEAKRDFSLMFAIIATTAIVGVVIYEFTGVNLVWLVM